MKLPAVVRHHKLYRVVKICDNGLFLASRVLAVKRPGKPVAAGDRNVFRSEKLKSLTVEVALEYAVYYRLELQNIVGIAYEKYLKLAVVELYGRFVELYYSAYRH